MEYQGILYFSFGYGGVEKTLSDGSQVIVVNEKPHPSIPHEPLESVSEDQKEPSPSQ
jgi:chorismate synthase